MPVADHHALADAFGLPADRVWSSLANAQGVVWAPKVPDNDEPLFLDPGFVPELATPREAVSRIVERSQDLRWVVCQMRVVTRILWASLLIAGSDLHNFPRRGGYHPDDVAEIWEWAELASDSLKLWIWFCLLLDELVKAYTRLHRRSRTPKAAEYLEWFETRGPGQLPETMHRGSPPPIIGIRGALVQLRLAVQVALQDGWTHAKIISTRRFRGLDGRRHPYILALADARRVGADESDIAEAVARTLIKATEAARAA